MTATAPLSDLLRAAAESYFANNGDHNGYSRLMDAAVEAQIAEESEALNEIEDLTAEALRQLDALGIFTPRQVGGMVRAYRNGLLLAR